ncbi:DUF934 domain-containing protein [Lentilitoribacter sp. EG35]|uniref:DUF934 domain-containing protein n=1 Tax=Lentilitoribacter sp. EG35 TaxID=3234192 RepID=UPI00345F8079
MTQIWTKSGFQADSEFGILADGAEYLTISDLADATGNDLAVRIEPSDDVAELSKYLDKLSIVAVHFPAFNDGRAFSHASLLRDRLEYKGEIRAFGHVLLDQVPLMLRCGIDSFEVSDEPTIRHLGEGHVPAISHHYQPSMDEPLKANSYSWRYMAKPAS